MVNVLNLQFGPAVIQSKELLKEVGFALQHNTSICELRTTGLELPYEWRQYCKRNRLVAAPPATPSEPPAAVPEINLQAEDWAFSIEQAQFEKLERLGGGSFGAVFQATTNQTLVAAKIHYAFADPALYGLEEEANRRGVVQECLKELSALRTLDGHPNVVSFRAVVFTVYQGDVLPTWICMELAESTLHDRIHVSKKVDLVPDMLGMLNGLEYIHSEGMMHRDLKPTNILIGHDGKVKIGDLGGTKVSRVLRTSMRHTIFGTQEYLAPEVAFSSLSCGDSRVHC